MALNLASPGILVREVDLTIGRIDGSTGKIGGLVGPFEKGPVDVPVTITGENEYVDQFGKPYEVDKHYETWMVGSSYLAYGGVLSVIRADDAGLKNAVGGGTSTSVKIKSTDHYKELGYDENTFDGAVVAAKNPGTWANGLRVAIIDGAADQILTMNTAGISQFTSAVNNAVGLTTSGSSVISGITTTSIAVGQVVRSSAVSAGTTVSSIGVSQVTISNPATQTVETSFDFGTEAFSVAALQVGSGIVQDVPAGTVISGAAGTSLLDGTFKGIVTDVINANSAAVKFLSHVAADGTVTAKEQDSVYKFSGSGTVAITTAGQTVSYGSTAVTGVADWFDSQTFVTTTATKGGTATETTVNWNTIADKPGTSEYAAARGGRFDEVHVLVIDAKGTVTGNAGTILEKHLNLSKAKDAEFSVGSPSYWRKYLYTNSSNIFGLSGNPIDTIVTGYESDFALVTGSGWDQDAEGVIFNSSGPINLALANGKNYGGGTDLTTTGALDSGLDDLIGGYGQFENDTTVDVDFLLMGSGKYGKDKTRALAEKLIAVAEVRKDAVAFISPHRGAMISDTNVDTQPTVLSDSTITDNVVDFYGTISSTTFAVFDSGYKYMYDRFNNTFRYVPLNGDIAGACARTDINDFPWFSPAGTDRGAILNAVKLPYNPTRLQRDKLYSNRVNPVIFSPGAGIILFGDKTGFAKASAFDRINVRRLFIYLEDGISAAAKDQLFEFNDEITRANFVNIVEPFLRDVQSKRGIQDYVVICDETNNTAAVIDNNEFIADIFVKPARSINFIGLTFIATRTGVSFEEVIGSV